MTIQINKPPSQGNEQTNQHLVKRLAVAALILSSATAEGSRIVRINIDNEFDNLKSDERATISANIYSDPLYPDRVGAEQVGSFSVSYKSKYHQEWCVYEVVSSAKQGRNVYHNPCNESFNLTFSTSPFSVAYPGAYVEVESSIMRYHQNSSSNYFGHPASFSGEEMNFAYLLNSYFDKASTTVLGGANVSMAFLDVKDLASKNLSDNKTVETVVEADRCEPTTIDPSLFGAGGLILGLLVRPAIGFFRPIKLSALLEKRTEQVHPEDPSAVEAVT